MALETAKKREVLEPRREPYWHKVGVGKHLGYRRTQSGGSWLAKHYDSATRKRQYLALTEVADTKPAYQFEAAVNAATAWFERLQRGGNCSSVTVADAIERYVEHQRKRKGDAAADDAASRYRRHIQHDAIAGIELAKLRKGHLLAWREKLSKKPSAQPKRGPHCRTKAPLPPAKDRAPASVNRDMVFLRAALNLAADDGFAPDPTVWRSALKPIAGATRRRELYLDRDQRRALLDALPDDCAAFARGLCLLPLRPGALASLTVADFNQRSGSLRITLDKAGEGRTILLPKQAAELIRSCCMSKHPAAPIFTRWDGAPWSKEKWKPHITRAVKAAKLPDGTTLYTLRHSTITDLVSSNQVDLLSIAQISGTSVSMIEKHYGHLRGERARDALEWLAL